MAAEEGLQAEQAVPAALILILLGREGQCRHQQLLFLLLRLRASRSRCPGKQTQSWSLSWSRQCSPGHTPLEEQAEAEAAEHQTGAATAQAQAQAQMQAHAQAQKRQLGLLMHQARVQVQARRMHRRNTGPIAPVRNPDLAQTHAQIEVHTHTQMHSHG